MTVGKHPIGITSERLPDAGSVVRVGLVEVVELPVLNVLADLGEVSRDPGDEPLLLARRHEPVKIAGLRVVVVADGGPARIVSLFGRLEKIALG